MKRKIPPYYVLTHDFNADDVEYYDVMPYFVQCWREDKKKKHKFWCHDRKDNTKMPETFEDFKLFVRRNAFNQFWGNCNYEFIMLGWPVGERQIKIDAFDQIEKNLDVVAKHFMDYINS